MARSSALERRLFQLRDVEALCHYCRDIRGERWPEAEVQIKKDPEWASFYAREVVKARWPEAEPAIKRDPKINAAYKMHFGVS